MIDLPDKNKLFLNFSCCCNWEEKYLYIIELGYCLPSFPEELRINKYLIPGCQSKVWIVIIANNDNIKLYGDSNALIIKGLIAILFILYQGLMLLEIIQLNVHSFFNKLSLIQHLTPSRVQGIEAILREIRNQAIEILKICSRNLIYEKNNN